MPYKLPHSPPAFSLARAKARPSPLMGSVLRAGKVPGFIFWLLSSGPMSCPFQQSEKYSTWTPQFRSPVWPQHGRSCSVAPSHPGAHHQQRRKGLFLLPHQGLPAQSPPAGVMEVRDAVASLESPATSSDQTTLGPSSLMFFYLPGRGRHTLRSFNRGSLT